MRLRISKIVDSLSRMRVASILRFARMFTSEIKDDHFDELASNFLAGLKDYVQATKLPEAKQKLDASLSNRTNLETANSFKEFVEEKLPNFISIEGEKSKLDWQGRWTEVSKALQNANDIPEEAFRHADDVASWLALMNGRFDSRIKRNIRGIVSQYSNEDLYSDAELVEHLFDQYNNAIINNWQSLQDLNNARMLVKGLPWIMDRKAWDKFRVKEKQDLKKRTMPSFDKYDVKDIDPINLLKTDSEVMKEFISFAQDNIKKMSNKPTIKNLDDAAEVIIKEIVEGGGADRFNIEDYFRNHEREMRIVGIDKPHQIRELLKVLKDLLVKFVQEEIPTIESE